MEAVSLLDDEGPSLEVEAMLVVEDCVGTPGQELSYWQAAGVRERTQWLQGKPLSHLIFLFLQRMQELRDVLIDDFSCAVLGE